MIIAVTGGRDYIPSPEDYDWFDALTKSLGITLLLNGGARGVDRCIRAHCQRLGIKTKTYEANWKKYGYSAGPVRNRQMLDDGKPRVLIAFPGGKGTNDCIKAANERRIKVYKRTSWINLDNG